MYGMCRDNKLKSLKTVEPNVEYFPLTSFDLSLEVKNCFIKNSIDLENSGLFILKEQTNCNCSSETWFIAAKYISANTLFSLQLSLDPIMCRQKKQKNLEIMRCFLPPPPPPPPPYRCLLLYHEPQTKGTRTRSACSPNSKHWSTKGKDCWCALHCCRMLTKTCAAFK